MQQCAFSASASADDGSELSFLKGQGNIIDSRHLIVFDSIGLYQDFRISILCSFHYSFCMSSNVSFDTLIKGRIYTPR